MENNPDIDNPGREEGSRPWGEAVAYIVSVLAIGAAATALFGYYLKIVDFEAAPEWSVTLAFLAIVTFPLVIGFIVFATGSAIEFLFVFVLVVGAYGMLWLYATPTLEPILLGIGGGLLGTIVTGIARSVLSARRQAAKPVADSARRKPRQKSKAERRRAEIEAHQAKLQAEREKAEAGKTGESPRETESD